MHHKALNRGNPVGDEGKRMKHANDSIPVVLDACQTHSLALLYMNLDLVAQSYLCP